MRAADEGGEAGDVVVGHVFADSLDDVFDDFRAVEDGGAHRYDRGAGEDELERVVSACDAAHADYRHLYGLENLIHHAQGHRLYGRAGEPACDIA